jgi:Na+-driven multidrug efflux pump
LQIFITPFSLFSNGVGKIKLSMVVSPIVIVANIPLSILFAKPLGMGIAGVIAGTAVCNLASLILSSIQYHKIVNHKATGIWGQ